MSYFLEKKSIVVSSWKEWGDCVKNNYFTVIGIHNIEIIERVKITLDDVFCNGGTERDFLNKISLLSG